MKGAWGSKGAGKHVFCGSVGVLKLWFCTFEIGVVVRVIRLSSVLSTVANTVSSVSSVSSVRER